MRVCEKLQTLRDNVFDLQQEWREITDATQNQLFDDKIHMERNKIYEL